MRIFHILVATLLFIVFFLPQESRAQNSRKLLVVAGQVEPWKMRIPELPK
jgi:hypothetical protein